MKSSPLVAIIIVVYNNYPDTRDCLLSLDKLDYKNYYTVVVDNGSTDHSGENIKENFHNVIVLRNNENLGYTGGCNTGIAYSCRELNIDYCLILNNDTVVDDEGFLASLIHSAEENATTGIVAPVVYDYESPDSIQCAGVHVNLRTGRARLIKQISQSPIWTEAIHGCAFLVKREVLEGVGTLDNRFYLYWEETDYCLRVRKAGYQIMINPETRILHKSGKTIGGRGSLYTYYFFRNRLLLTKKHAHIIDWLILSPLLPIYAVVHVLNSISEGNSFRETTVAILEAWWDFLRGHFGRRGSYNKAYGTSKLPIV